MGTKNNPGKFDCYEKAEPDEPMFTLLARDPQGADFVHLWAALRNKDHHLARRIVDRMISRAEKQERRPGDPDKVCEAVNCAVAMAEWHAKNRP